MIIYFNTNTPKNALKTGGNNAQMETRISAFLSLCFSPEMSLMRRYIIIINTIKNNVSWKPVIMVLKIGANKRFKISPLVSKYQAVPNFKFILFKIEGTSQTK